MAANAKAIAAAIAQVPAQLRNRSGARLRGGALAAQEGHERRGGASCCSPIPTTRRPAAWWGERQIVARRLLAAGNADLAYQVVQQHGLSDGIAYSEAEFLSGYIALRYMKKPALAFDHFSRILARGRPRPGPRRAPPIGAGAPPRRGGKSRSGGQMVRRRRRAHGDFYGQLAAHQLGHDAPPRPLPEPRASAAEHRGSTRNEMVRAAALFARSATASTRVFVTAHGRQDAEPIDFAMLATLAEASRPHRSRDRRGARSIDAGMPLMIHGYPVTTLPGGGTAERSLLFAIVRQESAFEQDAVSRAGARGLMQLMPGTAASRAARCRRAYSADRLTTDGVYNVTCSAAPISKR